MKSALWPAVWFVVSSHSPRRGGLIPQRAVEEAHGPRFAVAVLVTSGLADLDRLRGRGEYDQVEGPRIHGGEKRVQVLAEDDFEPDRVAGVRRNGLALCFGQKRRACGGNVCRSGRRGRGRSCRQSSTERWHGPRTACRVAR